MKILCGDGPYVAHVAPEWFEIHQVIYIWNDRKRQKNEAKPYLEFPILWSVKMRGIAQRKLSLGLPTYPRPKPLWC